MQEQLSWNDQNATLERIKTCDGSARWRCIGGDLLGITEDLLAARFGARQWYPGQVVEFGAVHVQLVQHFPAYCGWLARRM